MFQKQTNNQKRSKKQKQKEDELPLHAHSDIARYVPLQLYLVTRQQLVQTTKLLRIVNIKSKKKKLKTRFF